MAAPQHNFPIRTFPVLTSTNDSILEAGEAGAVEGTTHIARTQTTGRGREGRAWWSPPGAGLWMSTLLRPDSPRSRWAGLALVAGVAVRRALGSLGVRNIELEWPNDLAVRGKKLGGILCEIRSNRQGAWIALGIGVNIDLSSEAARRSTPPALRDRITCLRAEGPPTTSEPEEIARSILDELWPLYRRFLSREAVSAIVAGELAHDGRAVSVRLPDGTSLEGTVAGLGDLGELLVRQGDGTLAPVFAGDVSYPRRE